MSDPRVTSSSVESIVVRPAVGQTGPSAPETRRALLMCGKCRKPTSHRFIMNRRAGEVGAYEQVFACSIAGCHTERRYGLCV